MISDDVLDIEQIAEGVTLLRLSRPRHLNALDAALVRALGDALAAIGADPSVRAVVLTGAGRGFCSGIDVRDFGEDLPDVDDPALDRLAHQERMVALPMLLRSLPQPVLAAVNGPAVGGGMALALAADIRVAATSATFANAAIRLGLTGAEMGMSYHLPRMVGTSVAADWMLTGRSVDAEEALRAGLVSAVVPDEELLGHVTAMATAVAAYSPLAVRLTKRALQANTDATLDAALDLENRNQVITHATAEAAAARAAWQRP